MWDYTLVATEITKWAWCYSVPLSSFRSLEYNRIDSEYMQHSSCDLASFWFSHSSVSWWFILFWGFCFLLWVYPALKHWLFWLRSVKSHMQILYSVHFAGAPAHWVLWHGWSSACVSGDENMCLYLLPQAVHGAATADGVGPCGHSSHRAQTQPLCGQRWCSSGCQAVATWCWLWTSPAQVYVQEEVEKTGTRRHTFDTRIHISRILTHSLFLMNSSSPWIKR